MLQSATEIDLVLFAGQAKVRPNGPLHVDQSFLEHTCDFPYSLASH